VRTVIRLRVALLTWVAALVAACSAPAALPDASFDRCRALGVPSHVAGTPAVPTVTDGGTVAVYAMVDLPYDDARSHSLSGLTWDAECQVLWAAPDDRPTLVQLVPSAGLAQWAAGGTLAVTGVSPWDAEGLARSADGFYLADEATASIYPLSVSGQAGAALALPAHFASALHNKSLESLSLSPDGRFLFSANESALPEDGPLATPTAGTVVRILRTNLESGEQQEWAYLTDPVFSTADGYQGVSDAAALSDTRLLVLERAFVPGEGNGVRLYLVDVAGAAEVTGLESAAGTAPVSKTLVVDLALLPEDGAPPAPEPQPTRLLGNYEGLAIGPSLDANWRLVFLVTDDNLRSTQVARLLVLAVRGL
jgi:hypothetical protein